MENPLDFLKFRLAGRPRVRAERKAGYPFQRLGADRGSRTRQRMCAAPAAFRIPLPRCLLHLRGKTGQVGLEGPQDFGEDVGRQLGGEFAGDLGVKDIHPATVANRLRRVNVCGA
nr:hypothetical protein [Pseudoroseomonas coralli]